MKISTWNNLTRTWKSRTTHAFLTIVLVLPLCVTDAKTLSSEKDRPTTKTLPFLKSNKSFFKLPKPGEHIIGGRNKRDSLDFVGTVEDYSSAEKDDILQKHLDLRAGVSPEASNMEYMYWDDDLATMGEQWSSVCLWEHGQPDNISPYSSLGQNLWLGTGSLGSPPDPLPAVQAWYDEDRFYDYDTNGCSGVCGHYTQVVWANSIYVGCGRAFCASVSGGQYSNAWIVTCNYAPAGNYVGAKPYKSGSACTECDSGIGTCSNNQCRNCTRDGVECDCNAVCKNCGTKTADCTCDCQPGWYGSDCNTVCEDTHQYCWANPGWPGPAYCDFHEAVPTGCPLMCGICEEATGDEVCNEQTSTASGATDGGGGGGGDTTTQLTTEAPVTEAVVCGGMSQECLNGGTFKENDCTCKCTAEYQGDMCQNSKEEAQYGVLILFIDSIDNYDTYVDLLRDLVARFITDYCNDDVATCCGTPGKATPPRRYDFVTTDNVATAMGYPYDHETRTDAYWSMLIVEVPLETDLCVNGTEDSSRRKRDTSPVLMILRNRRTTDGSSYLPQDVLMEVVEENLDNITSSMGVTIDSVERSEVEDANSGNGGLAAWAIALIVIFAVIIIVVLVVVVILLLKGPKPRKNQIEEEKKKGPPHNSGNNNKNNSKEEKVHHK